MASYFYQLADFILSLTSLPAFAQSKSLRTKCISQCSFISGIFVSGSIHWDMCSPIFKAAVLPVLQLIPARTVSAQHFWRSHLKQWVVGQPQRSLEVSHNRIQLLWSVGEHRGRKSKEDCMEFILGVTQSCAGMLLRVIGGRQTRELVNALKT